MGVAAAVAISVITVIIHILAAMAFQKRAFEEGRTVGNFVGQLLCTLIAALAIAFLLAIPTLVSKGLL